MSQISQKEIAQALGYSQSLVSRVLNNRGTKVPDATSRKIWDFACDHGYRPRGIDLDLLVADRVSTRMVGFVLRAPLRLTSCNPIFLHALEGMHAYLRRQDVGTVFLGTEGEVGVQALARTLKRQLLVGLVLMGEVQRSFLEPLTRCGKPVVVVSACSPGLADSVGANLTEAGEMLVGHLHGLGHRRFGWIGSAHSAARLESHKTPVMRALGARGLVLDPRCCVDQPEASRATGHDAARQLLALPAGLRPTALVCFSAMMARGALNAFFQAGLHVPRDVSITAIDMTSICTEEPPAITSASTAPEELGMGAARLILMRGRTGDRAPCAIELPAMLAVRATTGPAPRTSARRPLRSV